MKILATAKVDFLMYPGDTFNLSYERGNTKTVVLSRTVDRKMQVDIAHVVEFEEGDLGLEFGIGGVFGKKLVTPKGE